MRRGVLIAAVAVLGVAAAAQEREDRTLLSQEQMNAIINEASGERAMHHVLELVPYQFVRPPSEYQGHFRESEKMAAMAKDYGFTNVTIEDFPDGPDLAAGGGGALDHGAEIREDLRRPRHPRVRRFHERECRHHRRSDRRRAGHSGDFEGKDVKGKFVLSTAPSGLGAVYTRAVAAGAIGALGISAIGAGDRAVDYPDQIVSTTVSAQPNTAAWALSPKKARQLETMLNRGQKVTIRSINKSEQVPNKQEIVHAEIAGDGSTTQEVAIGGHLFEGYIKQGANDDNSGCALTLEVGRAYIKLIKEGKLPRPKRTVNFQWVQEISGTRAWLDAHPDKAKAIIGDLNFDMEALRLTMSRSYWIMQRTPDTFPSYINDIGQSMMEYVSELTRERVRYRGNGYAPSVNITAPNGSNDAFYIKIDQHYGVSDHVTYMQYGIPAVMFITWPDMWYHSSQDTPDKQDSDAVQARRRRRDRRARGDRLGRRPDGRPDHEREPRARQRAHGGRAAQGDGLSRRRDHAGGAACGVEGRARRDPAPGERREGGHRLVGRAVCRSRGGAEAAGADRRIDRQDHGRVDRVGARGVRAARAASRHAACLRAAADARREGGVEPDRRVQRPGDALGVCVGRAWRRRRAAAAGRRRRAADAAPAGPVAAAAHERRAEYPARQETERARDPRLPVGGIRAGAARRRDGRAARARSRRDDQARRRAAPPARK